MDSGYGHGRMEDCFRVYRDKKEREDVGLRRRDACVLSAVGYDSLSGCNRGVVLLLSHLLSGEALQADKLGNCASTALHQ